ncbi:IstB-like ATP binding protein [compost metagenome]
MGFKRLIGGTRTTRYRFSEGRVQPGLFCYNRIALLNEAATKGIAGSISSTSCSRISLSCCQPFSFACSMCRSICNGSGTPQSNTLMSTHFSGLSPLRRSDRNDSRCALARGDGRYARLQRTLGHVQLLILDDWGLEPLNEQARHDLLEILEDRYGRRSTIITSQLPVSAWHGVIGDPTYADAILDRLVHNPHRIELSGDSLRRNLPRKA